MVWQETKVVVSESLGCDAYVKKLQPDKLEPKSEKCVFIGYPKKTIGYTFYHRAEGKTFVAKNGSLRRRLTLMVMLLSTKLDLSQKVFGKFKELTTMRPSHP